MKETTKLNSVDLYEENGEWYLDLSYIKEDHTKITEVIFPKVHLPIKDYERIAYNYWRYDKMEDPKLILNDDIQLKLCKVDTEYGPVFVINKLIREKVIPLTKKEIEERLGYKIVIVD